MNALAVKMIAVSSLMVLIFGVNGSADNLPSPPSETITVTTTIPASLNAIPISVCAGCQFSITLQANPTTGYSWRLGGQPDAGIVKLAGNKYNPPKTKMVGAGGEEIWTFQGVTKGTTQIKLEYARPWEKDVAPVKTQTFAVTVQ